ncbi:hypothetical protein BD324DRAFT_520177 [Kockovaella imperatae]|uniref:PIPK domain-containing protein n=1 Tax=Kockovaella imperatae TaxID=4999 RepID=A0A1Y1UDG8_9TREE|nr:hypothetical protein BD324DRAFT_520177 [Kockovaella imperatae]ORX36029.1 hypothetical protein BD324DRAFT_520177 [Kockovaella imperatae]
MDDPALDIVMSTVNVPVELPEISPIAPRSVFTLDHIPPRSTSPPLPPRKEALPPRYLDHLARLLRQWLEQQIDEGLSEGGGRLWKDDRLEDIERALWTTLVQGLLVLDWNQWALGAAERKRLWRAQRQAAPNVEEANLAVATPDKGKGSRPASIVSDKGKERAEPSWTETIRSMKGFESFTDSPPASATSERFPDDRFPGSFPSSHPQAQQTQPRRAVLSSSSSSQHKAVKPVFCLQFGSSTGTSLRRQDSVASTIRRRASSTGWWQGSGNEYSDEPLAITWQEGRFAIPDQTTDSRSARIVAGLNNDIPEGECHLAGGTFIVKGVTRQDEQDALEAVLRVLLFTIHAMFLELELLDAFHVPRETRAPMVPPKSVPRPKEKAKGFFNRLGRDTKGIFGGLLPRARKDAALDYGPTIAQAGLSGPPSPIINSAPSTPPLSQTTDRSLKTLGKLESMLHSTTPGLVFPMPSLLLRVREEDRVRREKAKQEMEEGVVDGLPGRAIGYRMGGDVRAGLGALASGLDTFDGWIRLQRLETLVCWGMESLCQAPTSKTMTFWGESDQTIEEMVSDPSSCDCKEPHVQWLLHGERRVGIKTVEHEGPMDVWTKCLECGASTAARPLGIARLFSFAKLVELMLYGHLPGPCNHTNYLRCIRGPRTLVLHVEPVTVLDTRLPKLQVGPNVGKRKPGLANAEAAVTGLASRDRKKDSDELRNQIDDVFKVLASRVDLLRRYVRAERDTGPADEMEKRDELPDQPNDDESLAALEKDLEGTRASLAEFSSSPLNDVRQRFTLAIRDAEERTAAWQKDHDVPEDFKDLPLNLPEYVADDKIHALPGSSILVRENEPSSIFAHALSSLPYFLELAGKGPEVSNEQGWTVEVKRRDAPRDMLSFRALSKKRSETSMISKAPMTPKPNQPSLEVSLAQVEGTMSKSSLLERRQSESESDSAPTPKSQRVVESQPPSSFRPQVTRQVSHSRPTEDSSDATEGTWTASLTSSFNTLLRIGSDMGSVRMRDRSLTSLMGPLDNSLTALSDKPHLQFTYTLEDRLKIGCTIYYATAFDSLRRRCAIDKSMVASLSRCDPWEAQGGKSKASFFMTSDKRYIVKQLVSKWNVSDTQALLEIAPVYFEHLAGTHNRATALTKIVGFYTFKLQDKNSTKHMDLLVMENLFYKQDVKQRFDLKGIEGRKAPKAGAILFDSEWLEGQTKSPILLHPHAKWILQEAISLDTRFLSRESIMDYSLLLGLDEKRKELVVGLVDAIGSFDFFKTIESRGKLALTRGGEVTVIPPDQYRKRFETAIKQYFIACPDKWSKSKLAPVCCSPM